MGNSFASAGLNPLKRLELPLSQPILAHFDSTHAFVQVRKLFAPSGATAQKKQFNKIEEIRKIEDLAYGCPILGFDDGLIIHFSQRLSWRCHKENKNFSNHLYRLLEESSVD